MLVHKNNMFERYNCIKTQDKWETSKKMQQLICTFFGKKSPQKWHIHSAFENAASRANPNVMLASRFIIATVQVTDTDVIFL